KTVDIRSTAWGKRTLAGLWLVGCTLCIFPVPVRAQAEGAIRGTVVAKADGSPVPGAKIRLERGAIPEPMEETTGAEGQFVFPRLAPGDYVLTVSREQFQETRYLVSIRPREVQNRTL